MTRKCSECGTPLTHPTAKTCGPAHRSKRSRRLKRQRQAAADTNKLPPHLREVADAVRGESQDIAHKVIEEEIRPVVRDSLTEEVLSTIHDMVGMAPQAVAALAADIASEDPAVRQKAYDMWFRYTVGNKAIAPAEAEEKSRPLIVNFDLPRPGENPHPLEAPAVPDGEAVELKTCDMCGEEKSEFIDQSDRCTDCYENFRAEVEARFSHET